jgi:multiple sugar transport system permease protein
MVPMMQIAGDIAPDVLYVNFRISHSYITKKLLLPLDQYLEDMVGVSFHDSSTMSNEEYVAALKKGPHWDLVDQRAPPQCWEVMRRECPYEADCPYRKERGLPSVPVHQHVWAFPIGPSVMGLQYDRTMFAEHADEGVEMRTPKNWDEFINWAKIMTRPDRNEYGILLRTEVPGWEYLTLLYSAGGEAVNKDEKGNWVCTLDTEPAAEAAYFYARLRLEIVKRGDREYRGVTSTAGGNVGSVRHAMVMTGLDETFLRGAEDQTKGFGPIPAGPTGLYRSEFNARMVGIFSGLSTNKPQRDAAWKYIEYYGGPDARQIQTAAMVEAGLGTFVRPKTLREFNADGRYDSLLRQIPADLEETYRIAFAGGVPEPYGKNCQYIYSEMNKPLGTILQNDIVRRAIDNGTPELAMPEIRRIMKEATANINQKMLGNLPAPVKKQREFVAWTVIILVVIIFTWVLRRVVITFRAPAIPGVESGGLQLYKYRWAYLLLAPALVSIGLWAYWPLANGTTIAFQQYSVTGHSEWVGAGNFASVLYDAEFWYSLRVSLVYASLYMIFGFGAPIALAFLLQEVPTGSIVYRTIYYLPAVLSGVVVIFLWKSFYSPDGLINQVLNSIIYVINYIPRVHIDPVHQNWLDDPTFALFFCLLPTIWAGMGPGCLIYLAALKTVPDELYEAADMDGASISRKVFSVALPAIKALVMINFIGAMIGAVRGASGFVLAMTGGGPYGQEGGATEVIGLKLFYTSFGQLEFGRGAAMAWVLGSMLIGFTVIQLQRLRNLEFRTTEKVG